MDTHLTSLPQSPAANSLPSPQPTKAGRRSNPAVSAGTHALILSAIACVSFALGLGVIVAASAPLVIGIAGGLAFAAVAATAHIRLSRPLAPSAKRQQPSVRRSVDAKSASLQASLEISEPRQSFEPPAPIEPSDLALALLASLNSTAPGADHRVNVETNAWQHRPLPAAHDQNETEFERVDRLVKRLADNVNHLQAMRDAQPAQREQRLAHSFPALTTEAGAEITNQELVASINALKRANASPIPVEPPSTVLTWPPDVRNAPEPQSSSQRAAILAALNAERIDVFLEPILDLGDQRPQHYEVSIALKTVGGHIIDLADAASDLSGTGLLPLIDQACIARAADMARRLADRGKAGAVFTSLNGETLGDHGFSDTFANTSITVGAFPGQLVLTLSQAHVAMFATADWHTLARLRDAGFGFALSDVTTLDMDFASLADVGFTFARLDAQTFLEGLPTSGGIVPPSDICRHMAGSGLMLIVGGILEDYQLARIFGFGVVFGQGRLFGGPRPTKSEATAPIRPPGDLLTARFP